MGKKISILLIAVLSAMLLWSNTTIIDSFLAESSGSSVSIRWKAKSEEQITRFEVERSINNVTFQKIESINPSGKLYYTFVDNEAFMKQIADDEPKLQKVNSYYYKLKIIKKDNSFDYTETVNVVHKSSSFKRTWGMIKEMFR